MRHSRGMWPKWQMTKCLSTQCQLTHNHLTEYNTTSMALNMLQSQWLYAYTSMTTVVWINYHLYGSMNILHSRWSIWYTTFSMLLRLQYNLYDSIHILADTLYGSILIKLTPRSNQNDPLNTSGYLVQLFISECLLSAGACTIKLFTAFFALT
jgi:hypothetical protein